jgi:hypothetical protein
MSARVAAKAEGTIYTDVIADAKYIRMSKVA